MNGRLEWKLLADIIIHLAQYYHELNISSTASYQAQGREDQWSTGLGSRDLISTNEGGVSG